MKDREKLRKKKKVFWSKALYKKLVPENSKLPSAHRKSILDQLCNDEDDEVEVARYMPRPLSKATETF